MQYPGGKWNLAPWIIEHLPPHTTYVEPYGGLLNVLLRKAPSPVEVANDVDNWIANFFQVLRAQTDALVHAIALTPYHRGEWTQAVALIRHGANAPNPSNSSHPSRVSPLERARLFAIAVRQSLGGLGLVRGSWSRCVEHSRGGKSSSVNRWLNLPDDLLFTANRLREVQFECLPALELIEYYDRPKTVFYCDPPYHPSTRVGQLYRVEMTHEDHVALLDRLDGCAGSVLLSGYRCAFYDHRLKGWKRLDRDVPNRMRVWVSGRVGARVRSTESLWIKESV